MNKIIAVLIGLNIVTYAILITMFCQMYIFKEPPENTGWFNETITYTIPINFG